MKKIFKYELKITDIQEIETHWFAKIISAKEQKGKLCIWALVDLERPIRKKNIQVIGTGNPIEYNILANDWDFVDTVIMNNGLVWHIFADKL